MARKAQPKYTEEDVVQTLVNAFSQAEPEPEVTEEVPEVSVDAPKQTTWTTESGAVVVSYH
jgi:hypothetical protein